MLGPTYQIITQPNRAIGLLWAGAVALTVGLISAGLGLITAGLAA